MTTGMSAPPMDAVMWAPSTPDRPVVAAAGDGWGAARGWMGSQPGQGQVTKSGRQRLAQSRRRTQAPPAQLPPPHNSHSAAMPVAASVAPLPMKAAPAAALPAARPRLMAFLPAGGLMGERGGDEGGGEEVEQGGKRHRLHGSPAQRQSSQQHSGAPARTGQAERRRGQHAVQLAKGDGGAGERDGADEGACSGRATRRRARRECSKMCQSKQTCSCRNAPCTVSLTAVQAPLCSPRKVAVM